LAAIVIQHQANEWYSHKLITAMVATILRLRIRFIHLLFQHPAGRSSKADPM
jgi:hypothetical protein